MAHIICCIYMQNNGVYLSVHFVDMQNTALLKIFFLDQKWGVTCQGVEFFHLNFLDTPSQNANMSNSDYFEPKCRILKKIDMSALFIRHIGMFQHVE